MNFSHVAAMQRGLCRDGYTKSCEQKWQQAFCVTAGLNDIPNPSSTRKQIQVLSLSAGASTLIENYAQNVLLF